MLFLFSCVFKFFSGALSSWCTSSRNHRLCMSYALCRLLSASTFYLFPFLASFLDFLSYFSFFLPFFLLSYFLDILTIFLRHGASGKGNAMRNWELRAREVTTTDNDKYFTFVWYVLSFSLPLFISLSVTLSHPLFIFISLSVSLSLSLSISPSLSLSSFSLFYLFICLSLSNSAKRTDGQFFVRTYKMTVSVISRTVQPPGWSSPLKVRKITKSIKKVVVPLFFINFHNYFIICFLSFHV